MVVLRTFTAHRGCERSVVCRLAGLASTAVRCGGAQTSLVYAVTGQRRSFVWLSDYGAMDDIQDPDVITAYLEWLDEDALETPATHRRLAFIAERRQTLPGAYRLWMLQRPPCALQHPDELLSDPRIAASALYQATNEPMLDVFLAVAAGVTPFDLGFDARAPVRPSALALMVDVDHLGRDPVASRMPEWFRCPQTLPIPGPTAQNIGHIVACRFIAPAT